MPTSEITPGNPINDPKVNGIHTSSSFELNRPQLQTARFGELTPCFAMEVTPKDKIPIRSGVDVRSYTLKAPLLADITLKKDYFSVPLQAILPYNWEKLYKQPKVGDDVVAEDVNCGAMSASILSALSGCYSAISDCAVQLADEELSSENADQYVSAVFRNLVLMEYFLSSGSLVRNMAYSFSRLYISGHAPDYIHNGFDYDCEQFYNAFLSNVETAGKFKFIFYGESDAREVDLTLKYSLSQYQLCWHDFLQMIRENPLFSFVGILSDLDDVAVLSDAITDIFDGEISSLGKDDSIFINFSPVAAYQLCAFHYYSNDNIDYIYSAELFRQLMLNYASVLTNGFSGELAYFTYNGVPTLYDGLSAYYVNTALTKVYSYDSMDDLMPDAVASINYISTLFSFRRSLRFIDYFTGAKAAPLAVGDVNVAVNSNLVNVVDISRNIQRQRFFNAVNRIPQKIKDYVREIFNIEPSYDYHDPAWLGHVSDAVRVVENENTGEGQLKLDSSVTSVFRSNSERFAFEYTADRPGYLIGIMYFDIPRAYVEAMDRCWLHADRFDMFNPFMQFIGDQPITCAELGAIDAGNAPFAYTLRHMEYKQTFPFAAGGFVDNLPGWSFSENLPVAVKTLGHISPDFVRSRNGELDQFYVSLTGNTLASYFHFIVVTHNLCDASRPMAYSPQIL